MSECKHDKHLKTCCLFSVEFPFPPPRLFGLFSRKTAEQKKPQNQFVTFSGVLLVLQDLTALAKELRELRQGEETSRPPVKVTDYSSSSEESHSSEDEEGEGGANDGTVAVSDIPRIMWVFMLLQKGFIYLNKDLCRRSKKLKGYTKVSTKNSKTEVQEQGHDPTLASHKPTLTVLC